MIKCSRYFNFYALLFGIVLYSCAPPMYKPNAINAPQLYQKQDFKLAGNISVIVPGLDFQSAYAVTEHIGLMANFSTGKKLAVSDTSNRHQHIFGEMGIGYFTSFSNDIRIGIYGGFGKGKASANDRRLPIFSAIRRDEHIYGMYNRFFLQGEIGKSSIPSDERNFRIESCMAIRLTHVDFYKYESNYLSNPYYLQKSFIDIAPIIRISDGLKSLVLQPGLSYPLYTRSYISGFVSFPFFLQAGLEVSIGRKEKH